MAASATGQNQETKLSAPYISYLTFSNSLDWLATDGIPHRFDRSVWSKRYNGSVGPQLLLALRFLGLLVDDSPQTSLEQLVNSSGEERKALLTQILRTAYSHVNWDVLPKATPSMVSEWMEMHGVTGETTRKASSFFINALKAVEFSLPPILLKSARNKAPGTRTPRKTAAATPKDKGNDPPASKSSGKSNPPPNVNVKRIDLESGGYVTLEVVVNPFDISDADDKFVKGLIAAFRRHSAATAAN